MSHIMMLMTHVMIKVSVNMIELNFNNTVPNYKRSTERIEFENILDQIGHWVSGFQAGLENLDELVEFISAKAEEIGAVSGMSNKYVAQ